MPQWIMDVYEYLVGVQFHPFITFLIVIIYAIGKLRWEEPCIDLAKQFTTDAAKATPEIAAELMKKKIYYQEKANKISNYVMLVALMVSLIGEFSIYWPKSGQGRAICAFMSLAQVGAAWFAYYYIDKWGLMDSIGNKLKKKIDTEAPNG